MTGYDKLADTNVRQPPNPDGPASAHAKVPRLIPKPETVAALHQRSCPHAQHHVDLPFRPAATRALTAAALPAHGPAATIDTVSACVASNGPHFRCWYPAISVSAQCSTAPAAQTTQSA